MSAAHNIGAKSLPMVVSPTARSHLRSTWSTGYNKAGYAVVHPTHHPTRMCDSAVLPKSKGRDGGQTASRSAYITLHPYSLMRALPNVGQRGRRWTNHGGSADTDVRAGVSAHAPPGSERDVHFIRYLRAEKGPTPRLLTLRVYRTAPHPARPVVSRALHSAMLPTGGRDGDRWRRRQIAVG
ncbi:hypothetical protein B0H12DRAFT_156737 [Mycena haematopus]|nr:hypothetical protein B0H12DRAFT_156737 [Mycena haematopus]